MSSKCVLHSELPCRVLIRCAVVNGSAAADDDASASTGNGVVKLLLVQSPPIPAPPLGVDNGVRGRLVDADASADDVDPVEVVALPPLPGNPLRCRGDSGLPSRRVSLKERIASASWHYIGREEEKGEEERRKLCVGRATASTRFTYEERSTHRRLVLLQKQSTSSSPLLLQNTLACSTLA